MENNLVFRTIKDNTGEDVILGFWRDYCVYWIYDRLTNDTHYCFGFRTASNINNIDDAKADIERHFEKNRQDIDENIDRIEFIEKEIEDLGLKIKRVSLENSYNTNTKLFYNLNVYYGEHFIYVLRSTIGWKGNVALLSFCPGKIFSIDCSSKEIAINFLRDHFIVHEIAKILDGVDIYGE